MPAQPARRRPVPDEPDSDVLLSRQAVVDARLRVCGYRVAYARPQLPGQPTPDSSTTRLFGDVLTVVGLEALVGEHVAHLPISRQLLLSLGMPPVSPDRVLLRVTQEIALEPEIREILRSLANRGYALAVKADPVTGFDVGLLELFGTVELEFGAWDPTALATLVPEIRAQRAIPVAVALHDHEQFDQARALGFEWFTGRFLASPRITPAKGIPVGQLAQLGALARLRTGPAEIEELEEVINRDLGLTLKLLRYINSAYFGIRNQITSVRQAVMMLGARGVSRWAMLVTLTGGPSARPELSVLALTRARMCEFLAQGRPELDPDELFTIGMLSVADALVGAPLAQIVDELPLAPAMVDALVDHSGPAGEILSTVITYEQGEFDSEQVRANERGIGRAYLGSLRWARGIMDTALEPTG
jgi:c-di-GMP phosphodiesterase